MNRESGKKGSILRDDGFQTIAGSLLCIIIGLLAGYIVLLIINPGGAGKAILAILKNFLWRRRKIFSCLISVKRHCSS